MIGKATPTGSGFKGLVSYLMRGKAEEPDPGRVAWLETRNLLVDDPDMVPHIMRNTANRSVRCEKPVYHFVVSWHKDEQPTAEIMRQVGDTTIADLDLSEHQAILIAHRDTEHEHLHVVVNRVHPETHVAWKKSHDWRTIETSIGRQSKELGLKYVPGRHNEPDAFRDTPKKPRNSERQRAERLGIKDHLRNRWSDAQVAAKRPRLAQTFEQAKSWQEVARALTADGLDIGAKGQGLVIGDDAGTMKLSQLRRDIRLKGLEERFGETFAQYDRRREEEKRLAEMSRVQRMMERERQLEAQALARTTKQSSEEATAQDEPPQASAEPAPPAKERSMDHNDSDATYRALASARAEADLAQSLHGAGLVSQAQLRRAYEDRKRAQEEVDKTKTLRERFQQDLIQALTPNPPDPEPPEPEPPEPERPEPRPRDRKKDRER